MYDKIVIGIDQSYKNTGFSVCADGEIKAITSLDLRECENNTVKRAKVKEKLTSIILKMWTRTNSMEVIIERIRLRSEGFLNIDYIKSIGALNSIIVDVCVSHNIPCYSVDTRCWKAQIVGTSKPQDNSFGVDPKKWPTISYIVKLGYERDILIRDTRKRKKPLKGWFDRGEEFFYRYNDDAADSACIALYGFQGDREKLQAEH